MNKKDYQNLDDLSQFLSDLKSDRKQVTIGEYHLDTNNKAVMASHRYQESLKKLMKEHENLLNFTSTINNGLDSNDTPIEESNEYEDQSDRQFSLWEERQKNK